MKFNLHLNEFWNGKGVSLSAAVPTYEKANVDLFRLYKTVCKRGGGRV